MAASRASMWPWVIAPGTRSISPTGSRRAIKLWLRAASLCSSCRANERRSAATRICAAGLFDDESDRGLVVAAGLSSHPHDDRTDRRRVALPQSPPGGCLPRSLAAHRRDYYPVAWTCRRGSRTADYGARRNRDEWHPPDDDHPLDLALWIVRRHPHLSE